jgi:Holliday junction resolvase RusA-like endonuclease
MGTEAEEDGLMFTPIRAQFEILAIPKARARVTRQGHAYTPAKTKNFERELQWLWTEAGHIMLPRCPTAVTVGFFFTRPKSVKASVLVPTGRPDVDNLAKAVCDSLNGFAWHDDGQITDLNAYKRYTEGSAKILLAITPAILGAA